MFKNLLLFIGGLAVGILAYEALMKDNRQQQTVGMLTENELFPIEEFLRTKNANSETRYCSSYNAARHGVYFLQRRIEAAAIGTTKNGFLLSNMESIEKTIKEFNSLKKKDLKYDCEHT